MLWIRCLWLLTIICNGFNLVGAALTSDNCYHYRSYDDVDSRLSAGEFLLLFIFSNELLCTMSIDTIISHDVNVNAQISTD